MAFSKLFGGKSYEVFKLTCREGDVYYVAHNDAANAVKYATSDPNRVSDIVSVQKMQNVTAKNIGFV